MGLEDHQLRWLTNHMGHTEKVHLQNYRSTSGLIERLDIAKIMLMQEKNVVARYAGVRLDDINFEDLDDGPLSEATAEDNLADLEGADTVEVDAGTVSDIPDDDNSDDNAVPDLPRKPKHGHPRTHVKRISWTKEEVQEVETCFKDDLENGKCPGMRKCVIAIQQSQLAVGVLCKRNWETVQKKVSNMIKKREKLRKYVTRTDL